MSAGVAVAVGVGSGAVAVGAPAATGRAGAALGVGSGVVDAGATVAAGGADAHAARRTATRIRVKRVKDRSFIAWLLSLAARDDSETENVHQEKPGRL
jgi:hypothetical protein